MPASRPRILVTRSPQQASALADRLRDLGAEPVLVPIIETVEPTSFAALDGALAQLPTFHWLLFTSANAVEAFSRRSIYLQTPYGTPDMAWVGTFGKPPSLTSVISTGARSAQRRNPSTSQLSAPRTSPGPETPNPPSAFADHSKPRIAAIGPATSHALACIGLPADLVPPQAVAESLAQALLPHARQPDGSPTRFLLVRAEEAREHLPDTLRAAGAEVVIAPVYRTVLPAGAPGRLREVLLTDQPVQAVTFTSSSTARNLFDLLEASGCTLPDAIARASIGPITSATLRELGFPPHVEAPEATVDALARSLVKYLSVPSGS